jgi:hypothetical protein
MPFHQGEEVFVSFAMVIFLVDELSTSNVLQSACQRFNDS